MNDKIKESRLLFQRKGIMRREFLRNEIALSWARSQVLNVDTEKLTYIQNSKSKNINYKASKIFSFIEAVLIFNNEDQLICHYQRDLNKKFNTINYAENELGTNGIGLSKSMNRPFYVSGYEHYHQYFFDKITFGFPTHHNEQEILFGFILNLSTKEFLNHQSDIEELAHDILTKIQLGSSAVEEYHGTDLITEFIGNSELMQAFKKKISELKNLDNHIFLQGKKGSGKETVARYIHEHSSRKDQEFYTLYCDKLPTELLMSKITKDLYSAMEGDRTDLVGTIYCEGFETLTYKTQELLIRLLESKPVNSKQLKTSNSNTFRVIFSSENPMTNLVENGKIHPKLKHRINLFTVELPELKNIREDLPLLIVKRIEKYTRQFLIEPVVFNESLMNYLIRYDWPENYRELDKVIEMIIYKGRSEKVIDMTYLPSYLEKEDDQKEEIISLEVVERREIIRALELMNYNMALTAKALGIGRSTLYRKVDKYNIDL